MSRGFIIRLNKDIIFKSGEEKTEMGRVFILLPKKIRAMLKEVKGEDTWLSLLVDGCKYRGMDIEYLPNLRHKTHYYCTHCEKWIPHEEGIYKVARARVRCPECFLSLRTSGLESTFNYEELES